MKDFFQSVKLFLQVAYGALVARLVGKHVLAMVVEAENGLIAVAPRDNGVGGALRWRGTYGREEIERIAQYLPADGRVLNVGSHVGSIAIPVAKMCRQVIAVEPNPDSYRLLKMNLALNGVSNCVALNLAASDAEGDIPFLMNKDNSGGSKRAPASSRKYFHYYDAPQEILVPGRRLDECLDDKKFDVIIMDIEGSEIFALRGMPEILAVSGTLVVEFIPYALRHVANIGVPEFLDVIEPHFSTLVIPSKGKRVTRPMFRAVLTEMFNKNENDAGLIFRKE